MHTSGLHAIAVSLLLLAGTSRADQDVSKVNGAIRVAAGETRSDLSTVNGSVTLDDGVRANDVSTVNGSIQLGNNVRAAEVTTVNGSIKCGTRAQIAGDVTTVNGAIFLPDHGEVKGDVTTVNGGIGLVRSQVSGDITTVNGDITVGIGSRVAGNVVIRKPTRNGMLPISIGPSRVPRVIIGPDAVVDGELRFERPVKLYVHSSARTGKVIGATAVRFDTPVAPAE